MAEAGADIIVAHVGTTLSGMIGALSSMSLDEATAAVQSMRDAAKAVNPEVLVLCHGGPIATPDDVSYVLTHVNGLDGFFGASSMERLPVEIAIAETTARFKAL